MPLTRTQRPYMIARRAAALRGDKHYEGRPCKAGHTLRYTSCARCVACTKFNSMLDYHLGKVFSA